MKKTSRSKKKLPKHTRPPLNRRVLLLVILVLVAFLVISIYYMTQHSTSSLFSTRQTTSTPPTEWVWDYQNGFKIKYPKSWGKPNVGISESVEGKGIEYVYDFRPGPEYFDKDIFPLPIPSRTVIEVFIRSDDYKDIVQDGSYRGYPTIKDTINTQILPHSTTTWNIGKSINALLYHDKNLYIILEDNVDPIQSVYLEAYRLVSLPKINVSGASINYQIYHSSTLCPVNKLAENDNKICITKENLDQVKQVITSIQPN